MNLDVYLVLFVTSYLRVDGKNLGILCHTGSEQSVFGAVRIFLRSFCVVGLCFLFAFNYV